MSLVPRILRQGIAFYRKRGFWALMKAGAAYLWNEYQVKRYRHSLSLKAKPIVQSMRIFYIDYFSPQNSNLYWLKAFQKFGKVKTFDIVRENKELLKEKIMDFRPVHIHLGGSVKDNMVSPQLLANIKRELNCTVSVFYGDCEYSPYHCQLAESADYIYISNKTHIKVNEEKGHHNFRYMPCPTAPDIFNYKKCRKRYDLVFIGNNNQAERLLLLKSLAGNFSLKIFGSGWEETGFDYGEPVYGKRFSRICNRAKICLSIVEPRYANLEAYFSNRLVNTLATRSFCIQTYTPGLEGVFTNHKQLVWYTSHEELFQMIQHYLGNEAERERIAAEGQREVYQKYTYDRSVVRILGDVKALKPLKLHLGCGSNLLEDYINIDKYNPKADMMMDACELDYPDDSVDEIFTSHMVEHLTCPEFMKALKEWKRVLKGEGKLVIRCPNFEKHLRDWLNADYRKRWGERNEGVNVILGFQDAGPGHLNRNIFTSDRLSDLVSRAGFEIMECHPVMNRYGDIPDGDILLRARKQEE
jgi:SAM-dependent methyltransferase